MTGILEEILNRFTTNIIALTLSILGIAVFLDIYIIKDELLKLTIIGLGLAGTFIILTNIWNFIKNTIKFLITKKVNKKNYERNNNARIDSIMSTIQQLPNEERVILKQIYFNEKKRFLSFAVSDLIDNGYLDVTTNLYDKNQVIVELKPIIRESMSYFNFNN